MTVMDMLTVSLTPVHGMVRLVPSAVGTAMTWMPM